jgi:hypothetical protein
MQADVESSRGPRMHKTNKKTFAWNIKIKSQKQFEYVPT